MARRTRQEARAETIRRRQIRQAKYGIADLGCRPVPVLIRKAG